MSIRPAEIVFDKDKCTLLLEISATDIQISSFIKAKAREDGLDGKKDFHITVLGFKVGQTLSKRLQSLDTAQSKEIMDRVGALINKTSWQIELTDLFYKITKYYQPRDGMAEERMSYIQMVNLDGINIFIQELTRLFGINIDVPPAHVTIFSKSSNKEKMLDGIGLASADELRKANPVQLIQSLPESAKYSKILLPTRAQPDTIIAIFILKQFGESKFSGVNKAGYDVMPRMPDGKTEPDLAAEGHLLIDVGGGIFDHHNKPFQTTASNLVAEFLGEKGNPALTKLLQFAERDDFYGKGIISNDPLDRAFGLSGLIGALNKKYVNNPGQVIDLILPILEAFYLEENKRAFEMPKEVEEKLKNNKAQEFYVRQRGKNLKCMFIETDNTSMAGFLRSKGGGGYDVVALRLATGHTNVLTRPLQKVDLRSLIVLIRIQEAEAKGIALGDDPKKLASTGALQEIPEWYYDPATNSLLNGGPNPQDIEPTTIDSFEFKKLLEVGLAEKLWQPE